MAGLFSTLLGLILLIPSGAAFAQGDSTPSPTVGDGFTLLTEEQVPDELVTIQDGERTLDDVASGFGDPEAAIEQFTEWGWQHNVVRAFQLPEGAEADLTRIDGIYVSVHEFGSPNSAAEALDYSMEAHAAGDEFEEMPDIVLGEYSRGLYGEMSYGDEVTLYVQQGNLLIRLSAASPVGDPTEETLELMRVMLDSQLATPVAT